MIFKTLDIVDTECRSAEGRLGTFCLPSDDCKNTCLFPSVLWNCLRCQNEPEAYMPFRIGDKIQFQTRLADQHHIDPTNPVDPFAPTATIIPGSSYRVILNLDSTNEFTIADFTSRTMIAWSGDHSYQIVEIDTSLPIFATVSCWQVTILSLDLNGDPVESITSEIFQLDDECEPTISIKSSYNDYDCCGNYYGTAEAYAGDLISYDNRLRFWGKVHTLGFASSANFDFVAGQSAQSSRTLYRFNTTRWYPPYQRELLQNLLEPRGFTIDSIQYDRPDYSVEGGRFKIPLLKICEVSNIC